MKKVESGSGATDFGASMTPEEREGRPVVKSADGWIPPYANLDGTLPHDIAYLYEDEPTWKVPPSYRKLDREKIAHLIYAELVKFTSIRFTPDWIDAAADSIIEEYG